MKTDWLKTRQTKFTAYATGYILIILAVLVMANWLANRHNKSIDTTSNKQFSLSDQTAKVVGELKQDVKISYFNRTSDFAQAKDLLERYDNLSAKLTVDYIDPDKKPQIARAAAVRSYGTIFVDAGTRREEAKSLTEEEITGALIRALKGGERMVCAVSGGGEHSLDETGRTGYSEAKESMESNNYKTQAISLLDKPKVPEECTILLVAGPRYDYLPPVVNAIKTYVESGGKALILTDAPVQLGGENVSENKALVDMLAGWGVKLDRNLVLDTSGIGQLFGFSEVVPLVTTYTSHPIVREMKNVASAFPLVRSLEASSADKTSVETLLSTSDNSFATTNLSSAEISIDPDRDKRGPFSLAAAGTYNTGTEGKQGRFVVVGSSGWVANNIIGFNGNRDLFLNMLNWLSMDEDLISIRPKDPEDRRLSLNRNQMRVIFYSSVILVPLFVVAAGAGVWWRRR
ncbi:MAG: GldG family protein [Bryobacteraceae bacterium]